MRNFLKKFREVLDARMQQKEREEYLKSIFDFKKPVDDKTRIGLDIDGLQEFDLVDETSKANHINGHMSKRFVRLHQGYFTDYFEKVRESQPNCSYESYLENDDVVSGDIPQNLSVLLKHVGNVGFLDFSTEHRKLYSELVCPSFMNYFGSKTVYNGIINQDETMKFYVMSLDFIKPHEHFYMSTRVFADKELSGLEKMEDNVKTLQQKIYGIRNEVADEFKTMTVNADSKQIEKDFMKSYLCRCLFLGDRDYRERNHGFVYNDKTHELRSAPNFDYELGFFSLARSFANVNDNMKYIYEHYPEIMEEFMGKVESLCEINPKTGNTIYCDMIERDIPDREVCDEYCRYIADNSMFLRSKYAELKHYASLGNQQ